MVCDSHTCAQMVDGNDGKGGRRLHHEHLRGKQMKVFTRQKESTGKLSFAGCVVPVPKFRRKDCAGGPIGQSLVGKDFQCTLPVAVVGRFGR